jgi:hypothetical protein
MARSLDEHKLPLAKFVAEMDHNDKAVSGIELSPRRHWGKKTMRMGGDDDDKDGQGAQ